MANITLNIGRSIVMDEVAKLTDYVGSKSTESGEGVRERVLATDAALRDMQRFATDALTVIRERLKNMIASCSITNETYVITLDVSKSFNTDMLDEVMCSLESFMVNQIAGQWFRISNKGEANEYLTAAAEFLTAAERMLYSRKRPTLPSD